jgi:pyroglutamyl-peptidase
MKILLTGFEPFGKATTNPSGEIVKQISGDNIVTAILPVAYAQSAEYLLNLIEKHNPDVVISLGQAEGRKEITPERIAINLDDARLADNEGVLRSEVKIIKDAPDGYFSTLPLMEIVEAINGKGVPAAVSLSAGTFLCNHIFYVMQNKFAGTGVRSGFVHVPLMDSQAPEFPGLPTMPLDQMVLAVRAMLEIVAQGYKPRSLWA